MRTLLLFLLILLIPVSAHACPACVDYYWDWRFPFIAFWIKIFLFWLLGRLLLWVLAKVFKLELIQSSFRQRIISFVIWLGLFLILIFYNRSFYFPFLIIVPIWLFSIYKTQKILVVQIKKNLLQKIFINFQWTILLMIFASFVYSFSTIHSTSRLIVKLDHPPDATIADELLLENWEQRFPDIKKYIEEFDEKNWSQRNSFAALMKLVRHKGDQRLALSVAQTFKRMHYINNIHMDWVFQEIAKTLAVLNKSAAAQLLTEKLKDDAFWETVDAYSSRDVIPDFIEAVIQTQDKNAIDWTLGNFIPSKIEQLTEEVKITHDNLDLHELSDLHERLMRIVIKKNEPVFLKNVLSDKNIQFLFWELESNDISLRFNAQKILESLGAPEIDPFDAKAYRKWWEGHERAVLTNE